MDVTYSASTGLEALLNSVDRPGDYFAHGRSFHPMPRIAVDGVGVLSFPVPDAQIRALIAVAERAPYGRGPDTRVGTSVRDCRQIGAARMQVAGGAWPETFARIELLALVERTPADRDRVASRKALTGHDL